MENAVALEFPTDRSYFLTSKPLEKNYHNCSNPRKLKLLLAQTLSKLRKLELILQLEPSIFGIALFRRHIDKHYNSSENILAMILGVRKDYLKLIVTLIKH